MIFNVSIVNVTCYKSRETVEAKENSFTSLTRRVYIPRQKLISFCTPLIAARLNFASGFFTAIYLIKLFALY
jgi:hypothetical protein